MVLFMSQPPRAPLGRPCPVAAAAIDIVLDDLQALAPSADALHHPDVDAAPAVATRPAESEGVHLRIDPQDHQRVRISGSMREVCAALDALIAVQ
jgi:hypothetical protein